MTSAVHYNKPIKSPNDVKSSLKQLAGNEYITWDSLLDIFMTPNRLPLSKAEWNREGYSEFLPMFEKFVNGFHFFGITSLYSFAFDPEMLLEYLSYTNDITKHSYVVRTYNLDQSIWFSKLLNSILHTTGKLNKQYVLGNIRYLIRNGAKLDLTNVKPLSKYIEVGNLMKMMKPTSKYVAWIILTYAIPNNDQIFLYLVCKSRIADLRTSLESINHPVIKLLLSDLPTNQNIPISNTTSLYDVIYFFINTPENLPSAVIETDCLLETTTEEKMIPISTTPMQNIKDSVPENPPSAPVLESTNKDSKQEKIIPVPVDDNIEDLKLQLKLHLQQLIDTQNQLKLDCIKIVDTQAGDIQKQIDDQDKTITDLKHLIIRQQQNIFEFQTMIANQITDLKKQIDIDYKNIIDDQIDELQEQIDAQDKTITNLNSEIASIRRLVAESCISHE